MNRAIRVRHVEISGLVAVLMLGWFLRLYRIGTQSLWYDEGTSATVAPRDVATIISNAANDIHPPLYYLLLHFWVQLAGNGETAVRYPSAVLGVLTIVIAWAIGRRMGGQLLGLVAALLLATSPLAIWYGQEARMYAQVAFLGIFSSYVLIRAAEKQQIRLWILYGISIVGVLYTHYFAASIPLAHGLSIGLWIILNPQDRLQRLWKYLAASIAAVILFLPWLLQTANQLRGWPATSRPFGIRQIFVWTSDLLANGPPGSTNLGVAALATATSVLLGLFLVLTSIVRANAQPKEQHARSSVHQSVVLGPGERRGPRLPTKDLTMIVVAGLGIVPLVSMIVVSLSRPFFHSKFLLLIVPATELLSAAALVWAVFACPRLIVTVRARQILRVLLTLSFAIGLVFPRIQVVAATWNDSRLGRDDYRGLTGAIGRDAASGDAIILNAPGQIEIFEYYYRGQGDRYPLPSDRPADRQKTESVLTEIAALHSRVWLVLWAVPESDPDSIVERWLDERMFKTVNQWYGGVRLAAYQNPLIQGMNPTRIEVNARFGDLANLASIEFIDLQSRPGGVVPLTLNWEVQGTTDVRYTVFVHLLDRADYLWGQRDSEPVGGARPTAGWIAGEVIHDRHGLPVLSGTPPGEYLLEIGLYRGGDGARLPVFDRTGKALGDRLLVSSLNVQPGAISSSPPPTVQALNAAFGSIQLIGRALHPVGRDDAAPSVIRGELLLLSLYWRSIERADQLPLQMRLEFVRDGALPIRRDFPFTLGRYPVENWSPDELVRDPYKLATEDLAPGKYQLRLSLLDGQGRVFPTARGDGTGGVPVGDVVIQ